MIPLIPASLDTSFVTHTETVLMDLMSRTATQVRDTGLRPKDIDTGPGRCMVHAIMELRYVHALSTILNMSMGVVSF